MSFLLKKCYGVFRSTIMPLFLICACPPIAIMMWHCNVSLDGSIARISQEIAALGIFGFILDAWAPVFWGSKEAWTIIGVFMAVQLFLMRFVPGKPFFGPITPKGNVPVYKANGVTCYFLTIALFCIASFGLGLFSPTIAYDHLGEILGAMNIFSLVFCAMLYLKGRFKPSSTDYGTKGNIVFDYYWGTELYPRIAGIDIKMFTNCRFGMASWPILLISYAAKQHQMWGLSDAMFVAVALQLIYITKFYVWETGYLRSLDIMHDRAGFYICWGCLVWVPAIYTSSTMYMVNHPNQLGLFWSSTLLVVGGVAIMMNYFADRQRQMVRAKNGDHKVWKRDPVLVEANYTTAQGEKKKTILLASGFWGVARHFHYIPEIVGALMWTLPALFASPIPYFYVVFLTLLLTERATRDDIRCKNKYGEDWEKYCKIVPYKMVPYVY
jgi:7-dehydrocholesterol reductase